MTDQIIWFLIGFAAGSSLVMGTQFMRRIADRWYQDNFKGGEKLSNYIKNTLAWDEVEKEIT